MKLFNAMFSKVNGGLEQVFLNYIPALSLQGNDVLSIIHPQAEIRNECPQDRLVTIHNFNQHDFLAIYRLRKLIDKEQPDCIITHSHRAAYLFAKTKTSVPRIAVCHVKGNYQFGSDAIIALTDAMRDDIINSGQPEHTVFTVPNMITIPTHLTYQTPAEKEIPIIGACARFSPIKGIDVLIDALGELKRRNVPFHARIAGDGKEKEHYIELINRHQLNDQVTLLGWIEDRDSFYKTIDIFCLPSREESFGLVVLEAMMHSLPMVLSRLSGPCDIVGESKSALFVPPEDPQRLADALEQMVRNYSLRTELSTHAFDRVHHFSNQSVGARLQQVIETVCARS